MAKYENNPWYWSLSSRLGERAAVREFLTEARSRGRDYVTEPVDNCPHCGAAAWFRPLVGATQCPQCGALRRIVAPFDWTMPEPGFVPPMSRV